MAFRVSFFWQQNADLLTGWSENYWSSLSDQSAVVTAAEALRKKLDKLHGGETICPYVRISDASNFRQVEILRYSVEIVPNLNEDVKSDFPDTAILLKLYGPGKTVVNQWLRGIRDRMLAKAGGKLSLDAVDRTAFNAFAAELKNPARGWSVRVLDPAQAKKKITSITAEGVVTVPTHGYENGHRVRISSAKGLTYANKLWDVTGVTANTFNLVGWNPPVPTPVYGGNATARRQSYVFQAITDVVADRATGHKSGRPFGLRGGRRKTRSK